MEGGNTVFVCGRSFFFLEMTDLHLMLCEKLHLTGLELFSITCYLLPIMFSVFNKPSRASH